jgi:tetratricopeptide (TPR) repeat protein
MTGRCRCLVLALCLVPTFVLGELPTPSRSRLPGVEQSDLLERLWEEGILLEERGDLAASAEIYEAIARLWPIDAYTYWRIARNYWNLASALPEVEEEKRAAYLRLTEEWSDRGLEIDPRCGECCLYKVAGLGGRLRRQGKLAAAGKAKEIAALLERGIEILRARPAHRTDPELEELYYAAAQFYRTMPDSAWLKLFLGVRGSRRRALEYMREANAIATAIEGDRPAYLVELGAALLCVGQDEEDPALVKEGNDVLARLVAAEELRRKDAVSVADGEVLLSNPGRACDFQR